ncbi:MAG: C45 family autoproteolytic acyltransferase/hydrolase [Candidatus Poribacteria bacterium]
MQNKKVSKSIVIFVCIVIFSSIALAEVPNEIPIKGKVEVIGEGDNSVDVITVEGTPYEMGYAHGVLEKDKIQELMTKVVPAMCKELGINEDMANLLLNQVYKSAEPYIPDDYKEEMRGLADGSGVPLKSIHQFHMIPGVSEYHCTFFASWGKAVPNNRLIQIRALDYETNAHIQDNPAIIIRKPSRGVPFSSIAWAGFIGVVSGINSEQIAMSEIGDDFGEEHETLDGEPMIFVMRDVLQNASSLDEALDILKKAHRTSSFLYCIGDGKANDARALATAKDVFDVYSDENLPFPNHLDDVVYMSMGLDSDWNQKLFKVLSAKYGKITETVAMEDVMTGLGTGNLHAIAFDVTNLKVWVANAGLDATPAYKRVYIPYDLEAVFVKDGFVGKR